MTPITVDAEWLPGVTREIRAFGLVAQVTLGTRTNEGGGFFTPYTVTVRKQSGEYLSEAGYDLFEGPHSRPVMDQVAEFMADTLVRAADSGQVQVL